MPNLLERQFHQAMLDIYRRADAECGYRPTRFLQMVTDRGGLAAAKDLLHATRPAEGLSILWERKRLDLSVEALVCKAEWRSLFTDQEVAEAQRRLSELGYPTGTVCSENTSGRPHTSKSEPETV